MKTFFTLLLISSLTNFVFAQLPANNDVHNTKSAFNSSSELVGSSEHFEFYTDFTDDTDYWVEIKDDLEKNYTKYCGHWNIPGLEDFMDDQRKTKVYYTAKENISNKGDDNILDIKSGYFDRDNYSIFMSPLDTPEKINYYGSLKGLAVNTFAGYAVRHRILRDGWEDYLPPYFIEGFGLYEQGYRPNRDSVISYLEKNPQPLSHDIFSAFSKIKNSSEKDILTAHFQWCALFGGYREIYWFYGEIPETEKKFYYYFYEAPDSIRTRKYGESENFDIYCSPQDSMYVDSMKVWLERTHDFYRDSFQMNIAVRYPLLNMRDEQMGMDLTGYGNFNGGAGSICLSPVKFGIDYPWLIAHELGHVFNSLMFYNFPFGFYHEGMANFSGYIQYNADWSESRWFIEWTLYHYHLKYNREPTLQEFITNPYVGTEFDLDPYYYGLEFFRYLYELEGMMKINEFIINGFDFSVLSRSYAQIEREYLIRLKRNQNLYPQDMAPLNIPFEESFNNFSNGWTKPSYINPDNWQIDDDGTNSFARFYTNTDKNVPIESWLVSPALDTKNMEQVSLSFDFARYGEGIEVDIFYTDKFEGYTDSTNWNSLKSIEMPIDWGNSNTGEITISNPHDTLFIGIRMKSTGEQHQQLFIDNFEVDGISTGIKNIQSSKNNLKIYPNPVTSKSIIFFQTQTSGDVDLSVYDMQGRKIATLLKEKLSAGMHTIPIANSLPESGFYFGKLTTSEGTSMLKLIKQD